MGRRTIPPPPTRFGPQGGAVQRKATGTKHIVPPPPIPPIRSLPNSIPVQAKLASPSGRSAFERLTAPPPPVPGRPRIVQRMNETVTSGREKRTVKPKKFDEDFLGYSFTDSSKYDEGFEKFQDVGKSNFDEETGGIEQDDGYVPEAEPELPGDWRLPGDYELWPYRRPGWIPGTYAKLALAQTDGNKRLICGECGKEITLKYGKEEWVTKNSKTYKLTRPPIDHFSPDWIVRLSNLKTEISLAIQKGNKPTNQEIRAEVIKAFHDSPLRVTHMLCNSARPKSYG